MPGLLPDSPSDPPSPSVPAWWTRDRVVAVLVFGLALVVRLFHWREIGLHDPFFTLGSVDGQLYDEWARQLLAGDWLGKGVLYLGPLYPIFIAAVYAIFGESLSVLKLVQAVLGAATCVLVWRLARELFDRRVAALSGMIAALYGMLIFYGGTVMLVNLQVPLVLGFVWSALRALRRPGFARWALCGGILGLSVLARQTVLLIAPIMGVWIVFGMQGPEGLGRRFAWGATFGGVMLALILPFTLKNYLAGDDLVLLNSTGGESFYLGNNHFADGTWKIPPIDARERADTPAALRKAFREAAEQVSGRPLKPSEVSSFWLARALGEIRADPLRWLRLEVRKFGLFWNAYEVWNNRSIDVSRRFSWVLRLPLISFGLLAPFALVGLASTARRWREYVPIHSTLAAYLGSALVFFVLSRYRLPGVIVLIPFAAFAVVDLFEALRNREWKASGLRILALAVLAVFVHLPLANENRMHMAYYNLGNKYRELGRWEEAVDAYRDSLAENPNAISTWNNLALAYELGGRVEDAVAAWRQVGVLGAHSGDFRRIERATRHLRNLAADPEPKAGRGPSEGLVPEASDPR